MTNLDLATRKAWLDRHAISAFLSERDCANKPYFVLFVPCPASTLLETILEYGAVERELAVLDECRIVASAARPIGETVLSTTLEVAIDGIRPPLLERLQTIHIETGRDEGDKSYLSATWGRENPWFARDYLEGLLFEITRQWPEVMKDIEAEMPRPTDCAGPAERRYPSLVFDVPTDYDTLRAGVACVINDCRLSNRYRYDDLIPGWCEWDILDPLSGASRGTIFLRKLGDRTRLSISAEREMMNVLVPMLQAKDIPLKPREQLVALGRSEAAAKDTPGEAPAAPAEQGQSAPVQPAGATAGRNARALIRVPSRIPEFRTWVEIWRAVERPWKDRKYPGTNRPMKGAYKELSRWLKTNKPELACSPETLGDIIRAGEAGLLEHMPELPN